MNESRNEKAIVVLLAYFIGFCTAFIAFGINNTPNVVYNTYTVEDKVHQEASVISQELDNVSLSTEESGLYLNNHGEKILLSANKDFFADSINADELVAGFHENIVSAVISPDEKFVYYCEQLAKEQTDCVPIIFDIEESIAHKLEVNGAPYLESISTHEASWSEESLLTLSNFISTSVNTPWI